MSERRTAFRWAVGALYLYGALFVLLSIDLLVRVWHNRASFTRFADVIAIFFFEVSRSAVAAGALALGFWLALRRVGDAAMRALVVSIGFGTIAFTQAASFRAYPGEMQERLTNWLLAHDVPRALLRFLFGSPLWAVWFALAGLLLFATRFPRPVTAEAVEASGRFDRPGMMAGARLAGADVGSLFRLLTQRLLRMGALRPLPLGLTALVLAAVHHPLRGYLAAGGFALIAFAGAFGVVITLLRAGTATADDVDRERLAALRTGALLAAAFFLGAGITGLLPGAAGFVSTVLLAVAPAPALYGIARAALTTR